MYLGLLFDDSYTYNNSLVEREYLPASGDLLGESF